MRVMPGCTITPRTPQLSIHLSRQQLLCCGPNLIGELLFVLALARASVTHVMFERRVFRDILR